MHGYYKIATPEPKWVRVFLWDDIQKNETYRKKADAEIIEQVGDGNIDGLPENMRMVKEIHPDLKKNAQGQVYITVMGQNIILQDYLYPRMEVLVDALNNKQKVWDDYMLATLYKQPERFGVLMNMEFATSFVPMMGIKLSHGDCRKVVCVPVEKNYPSREDWDYKVHMEPYNEALRPVAMSRDWYTSDMIDSILQGHFQLVDMMVYPFMESMDDSLDDLKVAILG